MRLPWQRRTLENPNIPISAASIVQYLGAGQRTKSGVTVDQESAMHLAAVWRAVNLTSGTVASLPIRVFRDMNGRREEVTSSLFVDPMHPEVTWYEGIESMVCAMLLWGNAFALKIHNEAGTAVVRLLPIHPGRVTAQQGALTASNPSGKEFKIQGFDNVLTPDEILHIPYLSYNGLRGMSAIEYGRQAIGLSIAAEEVGASLFDSGLLNGGVLKALGDISEEQAEQVKQRWRDKTKGLVRSYEIALLSAGFEYIPATIPPEDAQWLETRRFGIEEVARIFGVPPALLFEYGSTGNVEADKLGAQWVKFGLQSLVNRIEDRLSLHLLPRGQFCEFTLDGLLRGDSLNEAEVFGMAIADGWMTVDEVRKLKNLPPLPKPKPAQAPISEEEEVPEEEGGGGLPEGEEE